MTNIDDLTPRQLAVGLMRGDKREFKQGYSAEAASLVAAQRFDMNLIQQGQLQAYCEGWADGAVEDDSTYCLTIRPSEAAIA